MKKCNKCGKEKPCDMFHKSTISKDGLQNMCKQCKKEANNNRPARDDTEKQLIKNVKMAKDELHRYRLERITQQEIEKQVAQAAIEEFHKKSQALVGGDS